MSGHLTAGQQRVLDSRLYADVAESAQDSRRVYRVVEQWHADAGHIGAFRHCTEQPCHASHISDRLG